MRDAEPSLKPDHPRACGEQETHGDVASLVPGSSPRMRGAVYHQRRTGTGKRIIPAHAGSSRLGRSKTPRPPDHPRACGEQQKPTWSPVPLPGSSPRMRGAALYDPVDCHEWGIIPAHAGSSISSWTMGRSSKDHPRACGEQPDLSAMCLIACGSSPRMRGAGSLVDVCECPGRIIPAHAGSSVLMALCGLPDAGSSPRMRGAVVASDVRRVTIGIIPAHAGSSRGVLLEVIPSQDHPRACGEQDEQAQETVGIVGSSPRMRGAEVRERAAHDGLRIIPAHAGSSHNPRTDGIRSEDHPRACGEQST